jgi:phenylalanyl-tRNA synthetase alpha chain
VSEITTESLQAQLDRLVAEADAAADAADDVAVIEELRVRYLGKKGLLTEQLKRLGSLPADARPLVGGQTPQSLELLR